MYRLVLMLKSYCVIHRNGLWKVSVVLALLVQANMREGKEKFISSSIRKLAQSNHEWNIRKELMKLANE